MKRAICILQKPLLIEQTYSVSIPSTNKKSVKSSFASKNCLNIVEKVMATLGNVNQLFKELKTEFSKSARDLKKCGDLLEQLKVNKIFNYLEILMKIHNIVLDKSN